MHYSNLIKNKGAHAQNERARPDQVLNSAGGYVFKVSPETFLERFLILGTDKPTYYASAAQLSENAVKGLTALVEEKGPYVVQTIVDISQAGRALKQDPGIFALALCSALGDEKTRSLAYAAVPKVCRTGSTILQFTEYRKQVTGWSRGMRSAISGWYNARSVEKLAYQVTKYRNRNNWTHRDVFRKAHPASAPSYVASDARSALYEWVLLDQMPKGKTPEREEQIQDRKKANAQAVASFPELAVVHAFNQAHAEGVTPEQRIELAKVLSHEMLPTEWKNEPAVWEALLPNMPMTATIRNLVSMTPRQIVKLEKPEAHIWGLVHGDMKEADGILKPGNAHSKLVCERILNQEALKAARIHPLAILLALGVYRAGKSEQKNSKGQIVKLTTWIPVPEIVEALDKAFYLAFGNVTPAGKRTLIGLDVSGSMTSEALPGLSAREICAAMCMVQVATEPQVDVYGFTASATGGYGGQWGGGNATFRHLPFAPGQRLADVVQFTDGLPFGGTDCALPMVFARENNKAVDTFVIYTDNETWAGRVQPFEALKQYRKASGINAKLVVCGVTATDFTIADPTDDGMLDVVGFDAAVPQLIANFSRGSSAGVAAAEAEE